MNRKMSENIMTEKKEETKKKRTKTVCTYVEHMDMQASVKDIEEKVKQVCKEKFKKYASLEIYIKPEEGVAYYVVDGNGCEEYKVNIFD